jgi:hypothetical protein
MSIGKAHCFDNYALFSSFHFWSLLRSIFGLESHPAILVVTPKFLHVLDGFQLRQQPGSAERQIEWTLLTGGTNITTSFSTATTSAAVARPAAAAPAGYSTPMKPSSNPSYANADAASAAVPNKPWIAGGSEETEWLRQIWQQFLREDIGYFRLSIDQVT